MTPPADRFSERDHAAMQDALALAAQAIGLSDPNPRVGCIIVAQDGRTIGRGYTQPAGHAHAEIQALADAQRSGQDVRGATAYVTLEPCAHQGRTPPCTQALINANIARVVAAVQDPNPQVCGQGFAQLRSAQITTQVGLMAAASIELNIGFFNRMQHQTPWVRLKSAISLDGRTALDNGQSQWITGPQARLDGHTWRQRAGAILTGIGTVLQDNPRLDVRLPQAPTPPPWRIVIDTQLRTPPTAQILSPPGRSLIYTARLIEPQTQALIKQSAQVIACPHPHGQVDLNAVLADLAQREINELHIEAGATLSGAFLRQNLVDECLIYMAPKLLGSGRSLATLGPLTELTQAPSWVFHRIDPIGPDLRLLARKAPHNQPNPCSPNESSPA